MSDVLYAYNTVVSDISKLGFMRKNVCITVNEKGVAVQSGVDHLKHQPLYSANIDSFSLLKLASPNSVTPNVTTFYSILYRCFKIYSVWLSRWNDESLRDSWMKFWNSFISSFRCVMESTGMKAWILLLVPSLVAAQSLMLLGGAIKENNTAIWSQMIRLAVSSLKS